MPQDGINNPGDYNNMGRRGAQPIGRDLESVAIGQAPAIGLYRVMLSENPGINWRSIDLSPNVTDGDASLLLGELLSEATEREIALRGEARFVQRLSRGLSMADKPLSPEVPLRLQSRMPHEG